MTSSCSKTLAFLLLGSVLLALASAQPLVDEGDDPGALEDPAVFDEYAELLDRLISRPSQKRGSIKLFRRSCIRRSGTCDHRPNDCCYNSACRCNLWGTNCRCQRAGLFQQWGK